MSETSGLEAANLRLAKAGGDVCRALGVYAESREAAVVNDLVRAAWHQAAELQRAAAREAMSRGPIQSWHQVLDLVDLIDPGSST